MLRHEGRGSDCLVVLGVGGDNRTLVPRKFVESKALVEKAMVFLSFFLSSI